MVRKKLVFTSAMFALLLLLPIAQAALVDDGYHFKDYENSVNVADYGEWWFFNLYQTDIQAAIQYAVWDPAHLTEMSFGTIYVALFYQGVKYEFGLPVSWNYIVTSEASADLIMGPNTITVMNGVYQLQGVAFDLAGNMVAWNLQYMQTSQSLNGFRKLQVYQGEELNWYVQMPSAQVYGVIVLNDVPISINAQGYHDHNWGVWKLYHGLWNWFQTSKDDFALIGFDFYALRKGTISLLVDGQTITFQKWQYAVINYDWILDQETMTYYPQKTAVFAFNGRYFLALNIVTEQRSIIGRAYMDPPVTWIVFESPAHFKIWLFGFGLCKQIEATGFREYSTNIVVPQP